MNNNKSLNRWSGLNRGLSPWLDSEAPFSDIFKSLWSEPSSAFTNITKADFSPGINIEEKDDRFLVTTEVPGMREEDLDISIDKERLVISGHKKEDYDEKDNGVHYVGRSYGSFSRSIPLNCEIDQGAVEAELEQGLLKLTLPKDKEACAQPKKITVKSK